MTSIEPLLDYRQRKFALRALKLSIYNLVNQLISLTLKYRDGNA